MAMLCWGCLQKQRDDFNRYDMIEKVCVEVAVATVSARRLSQAFDTFFGAEYLCTEYQSYLST